MSAPGCWTKAIFAISSIVARGAHLELECPRGALEPYRYLWPARDSLVLSLEQSAPNGALTIRFVDGDTPDFEIVSAELRNGAEWTLPARKLVLAERLTLLVKLPDRISTRRPAKTVPLGGCGSGKAESENFMRVGAELFRRRELEGAIECMRQQVDQRPADVVAWFNLGMALRQRDRAGDRNEAAEAFQKASASDRPIVEATFFLAQLRGGSGHTVESAALMKSLSVDPKVSLVRQRTAASIVISEKEALNFFDSDTTADYLAQLARARLLRSLWPGWRSAAAFRHELNATAEKVEIAGDPEAAVKLFRELAEMSSPGVEKWEAEIGIARCLRALRQPTGASCGQAESSGRGVMAIAKEPATRAWIQALMTEACGDQSASTKLGEVAAADKGTNRQGLWMISGLLARAGKLDLANRVRNRSIGK